MKSHTCLFLLKNVSCLPSCTFLRRTNEYAIEIQIIYHHHITFMCLLLLRISVFFSDISYLHTGDSRITFISAGQIFSGYSGNSYRSTQTAQKKNLFDV